MAVPGVIQLLKAFLPDFDPEDLKNQALQMRDYAISIDNRLRIVQEQQALILRYLGVDHDGSGQPGVGTGSHGENDADGGTVGENDADGGTVGEGASNRNGYGQVVR